MWWQRRAVTAAVIARCHPCARFPAQLRVAEAIDGDSPGRRRSTGGMSCSLDGAWTRARQDLEG